MQLLPGDPILALPASLAYAGIFTGMLFEGDLLLFGTAFLGFTGLLSWWIALPLAFAAALLGDLGWYWIGTRISPESGYGRTLKALTRIMDTHIDRSPRRLLFVSKLTYGLHRPMLMRFGLERLGPRRFFRYDLPATVVWFAVICALAFIARETLLPVFDYVRLAEALLLALVLLFVVLRSGVLGILVRLVTRTGKDAPDVTGLPSEDRGV